MSDYSLSLRNEALSELSKDDLALRATQMATYLVEEGHSSATALAQATKMKFLLESFIDAVRPNALSEVSQFGRGGTLREGVLLVQAETGVSYDYSADKEWQYRNKLVKEAEAYRASWQEQLKKVKTPGTVIVDEDGVQHTVNPVLRRATDSVKTQVI